MTQSAKSIFFSHPILWFGSFIIVLIFTFARQTESHSVIQISSTAEATATNAPIFLPAVRYDPSPTPTPTPTSLPTATPLPTSTPTPTPLPGEEPEVRGIWVSRFDWTSSVYGAEQEKIDEIVDNVSLAGFNIIYFQVRGTADAFYTPGLEPWSQRMTGNNLGDDPGWDPLAQLIEKAHAQNIQVHAYINVYPVWLGCDAPPSNTTPQHLYHKLDDIYIDGIHDVLQQSQFGTIYCGAGEYQRIAPSSQPFDNHLLAVTADIINRYDIDGVHLDHIRYGAKGASFDPASNQAYELEKHLYNREDWQRRQVNGTVNKFYEQAVAANKKLWLSAAVWPVYHDYWGWEVGEGYDDYYQDSKEWAQQGYIDSISPMIYPGTFNCPANGINDSFWTLSVWETLVRDFQASRGSRFVIPGIGTGYCSFADIENRIAKAREIGTAGHSLFSYRGLLQTENGKTYFELLRDGPYQNNATLPDLTWHD